MIKNKLSHHTLKCLIDFFSEYKRYQSSYRVILALVVIKRCFHCPLRSTRHTFGTRYFLWSSWWRQVIILDLTQTHLTTFHLLPDGRMSVKHVILWATILNNLDLTDMKLRSLTWYFLLVSPQESNGSILQKLMWAIQPEPEESEAPTSNHFTFLLLWFFIRPSSCLCLFRCFPLFCSGSFVSTPDVLFVVVFLVVMSQILDLSQVTVLTLISCQNLFQELTKGH